MSKKITNVKETISSAISARVVAAPQQDKKWEVEEKALTSDTVAQYLADTGVDIGFVAKVGIYAVQKARKLAQFAVGGRSALDPATRMILKAAHNLAAQGEVFSPKMQLAALSTQVEAEGLPVTKLGGRGSYTDRTASAQSQTTRQALVAMGMATLNDGGTKCLKVDFGHPVVRQALGIVDEQVVEEGASE